MSGFDNSTVNPISAPLGPADAETVYQRMVSNYASVGALAVLLWDILDNIPEDYRLFVGKRRRWSVALFAYITSRIGALGYSLASVIFSTAPTGNCALFDKVANAWCPVSIACSGFLFFLRLRAIYNRNQIVVAIFFVLWVALLAGGVLVPIGINGGAVGSTQYCEDVSVSSFAFYGEVAPLVFDTLVFVAISWRLSRIASPSSEMGMGESIYVMLFGRNLPTFTKSLLLDGQVYYLITIIVGISSMILTFSPAVPLPLSAMMEDPYLVVVNIMACRVFRRTRSGTIRESEIASSAVNQVNTSPIQIRLRHSDATLSKDGA